MYVQIYIFRTASSVSYIYIYIYTHTHVYIYIHILDFQKKEEISLIVVRIIDTGILSYKLIKINCRVLHFFPLKLRNWLWISQFNVKQFN